MYNREFVHLPESFKFSATELKEFEKMMQKVDLETIVTPINSISDLSLKVETGKTSTGYIYSDPAMVQLCSLLVSGFSNVLYDLSGQWRVPEKDPKTYSFELAVDIFNRILKLRFDRKVFGLQVIRNMKQKTIDGIITPKYRYLANSDLLSRIKQNFSDSIRFHSGFLYGRKAALRFVFTKAPHFFMNNDEYMFGIHFSNSEIGGSSVKAGILLINVKTNDCAMGTFNDTFGGRVTHSGRIFERKLQRLLSKLDGKLPSTELLQTHAKRLMDITLGFNDKNYGEKSRSLMNLLIRRKMSLNFSHRIIKSTAILGGSSEGNIENNYSFNHDMTTPNRTAYDLFSTLIREANSLPINQRESVEQMAYLLLLNKITL